MPIITTYPFKEDPLNKKDEIIVSDYTKGLKTKTTSLDVLNSFIVSNSTFIFIQSIPQTTWGNPGTSAPIRYVTHNLNKFASVTVVSDSNRVMIGNVEYINANEVQLTFSAPFSGKAYFN